MTVRVTVNGEVRQVPDTTTVADLLARLDLPDRGIAVEHNRKILRREHLADTRLADGDQIEIVQFVGGG
ncbi:MAG: sulfur carrier protein ThiS [Acidobacteriota bacterium]